MNTFNKAFQEYKLLFETPEDFNGEDRLVTDSPDVIAFVYFINKNVIVAGSKGYFISHSDLLKVAISGQNTDDVYITGNIDIDKSDMCPDNVITGRAWVNHNKVSIWDYRDKYWDDINLNVIFKKISKIMNINFSKYELEITNVGLVHGGNSVIRDIR